ncbi:GNAT family N-acetyltransferase [Paenibacillus rhizovicinus]|uniref:GNAT family N-acetyltransferase n=1 Tax=Paenibacillus rhizovicinus TaxID=2704463 RepID=A0A6C0P665_9BACL|nr:GNAT family N-acetyltransferase [Paenibacillus rhizovicinus]QHW34074.1 GNAT family N-acetyltransferase [Paenibacillus rhizovicinus]
MSQTIPIERLQAIGNKRDELSALLIEVVGDGASIGFLPPLGIEEARVYWDGVPDPNVLLYIALIDGQIAGSVQLHLCAKPNGLHRAEIAKLMTHPRYRRRGVASALMRRAEAGAEAEGRSLIVLDTREGDPSNALYGSFGYVQAGRIPGFARSADGSLAATILYYKQR